MMLVYLITNKHNGKVYVGKTKQSLYDRWRHHITQAKSTSTRNICKALRKYGKDGFTVQVLGTYETVDDMNAAEMAFIAQYRSMDSACGYNMTPGGDGDIFTNNPLAHVIKAKLAGRLCSPEVRAKMSRANLGRKHGPMPEDRKQKISLSNTGKKRQRKPGMPGSTYKFVDIQELVSYATSGMPLEQIAKNLGISQVTVHMRVTTYFGVTIRQLQRGTVVLSEERVRTAADREKEKRDYAYALRSAREAKHETRLKAQHTRTQIPTHTTTTKAAEKAEKAAKKAAKAAAKAAP